MEITLKRKSGSSDRDPLLIMLEPDENLPVEQRVKQIIKVGIGETIDLPEEVAYQVMGKYKGFFEKKSMAPDEKVYKTKIAKPEV